MRELWLRCFARTYDAYELHVVDLPAGTWRWEEPGSRALCGYAPREWAAVSLDKGFSPLPRCEVCGGVARQYVIPW